MCAMQAGLLSLMIMVATALPVDGSPRSCFPHDSIGNSHNPHLRASEIPQRVHQFIAAPVTLREIGGLGAPAMESVEASADARLAAVEAVDETFVPVEKDSLIHSHWQTGPDDPEYSRSSSMWALRAISAPGAWLYGQGTRSVVAAIVDSGIDEDHEDLVENVWRTGSPFRIAIDGLSIDCQAGDFGYDAVDDDCRPEDREQHGTNVSGIIGARGDNEIGTVGVNWKVALLPIAIFDRTNAGSASRAAKALRYLRQMKESGRADVRVVNLSWGSHEHSRLLENELLRLAELGVVIVASAGNDAGDNDEVPVYPAGYDTVSTLISVAATRSDGEMARSSNRGKYSVDIAAPGVGVRTTDPDNSYDSPFGTSMAAAVVTGAVALLASQCPELTAVQLKRLILNTADRREALAPHVVDGRFLNLLAAANKCASIKQQRLN